MHIRKFAAVLLTFGLAAMSVPATAAMAQNDKPDGLRATTDQPAHQTRSTEISLVDRELDLQGRLKRGLESGEFTRALFDSATIVLDNIRVQENELKARDRGLNNTDRDFIAARISELERSLLPSQIVAGAPLPIVAQMAPALANLNETPGSLICDGPRVLLSIGRDHATASVQRYGSANFALIVEAVASPYDREDAITLRVTGPGLNAKVDGARAGQYLMASTTTNFSLRSKHVANIEATVISQGNSTPQYVKIWGSCSTR
jgi:hypothetical protein